MIRSTPGCGCIDRTPIRARVGIYFRRCNVKFSRSIDFITPIPMNYIYFSVVYIHTANDTDMADILPIWNRHFVIASRTLIIHIGIIPSKNNDISNLRGIAVSIGKETLFHVITVIIKTDAAPTMVEYVSIMRYSVGAIIVFTVLLYCFMKLLGGVFK